MSLWLVRAGRHGEQEEGALQHGVAAIGWNELADLSAIKTREELRALYEGVYPREKQSTVSSGMGQLWAFIHRIQPNGLVVLPLKLHAAIAIGRITGPYAYRTHISPNIHHIRPVDWLRTDLPRTSFDPDLLYSFGSLLTVCQVQRNHAEERVQAMLTGKPPVTSHNDNKGRLNMDSRELTMLPLVRVAHVASGPCSIRPNGRYWRHDRHPIAHRRRSMF